MMIPSQFWNVTYVTPSNSIESSTPDNLSCSSPGLYTHVASDEDVGRRKDMEEARCFPAVGQLVG